MGRLKDEVANRTNGRPANRVQQVLDALEPEDRADLLELLGDKDVSSHAIESSLRRHCNVTLSRNTVQTYRENTYPEVFTRG